MTSITEHLLTENVQALQQGLELLAGLDPELYRAGVPTLSLSGPGPHFRHLIDFYDRLLGGLADRRVDYDARERDELIERDLDHATGALDRIIRALTKLTPEDVALEVRGDGSPWMPSSLDRELQSLASHTVHHYALIAVALRAGGVEPGTGFGVAPSTLRHWSTQRGRTCEQQVQST